MKEAKVTGLDYGLMSYIILSAKVTFGGIKLVTAMLNGIANISTGMR